MTREQAIKVLEEMSLWKYCEPETEAANVAIAALREQPQWISVEERLPEDNRVYHVVCKYGPKCVVSSAKYKHGKWEEVYSRYPVSPWKVTHWMPLPCPPTKEEV